jgi:hypothetical protein
MGAMGGRVVVDVRRLAGEKEALLERTGEIFSLPSRFAATLIDSFSLPRSS